MNVELRGIHKRFGSVHANAGISLAIPAGTIQGILGENGAGKSTLMKVLSGFIRADSGEILLDGQRVHITSPAEAIRHGIGMLHQDPLDFPPMRVMDDFLLGRAGGLFPRHAHERQVFERLAREFDFAIHPDSYVDSLTVGERQQLEILRLLSLGARVLILDEPTTGISASQKQKLFSALRKLAEQGMLVIFVSHKLEDVEFLCDRIAVFRSGILAGEARPPYETGRLVDLMFGKSVSFGERHSAAGSEPVLSLRNLSVEDFRLRIANVDLDVHAGEVVGLAGMEGSGQTRFLRACSGLIRPVGGRVLVGGADLTGKSYHVFKQHGVEWLPASRLEEGLVPGLNLAEHFALAERARGTMIDRGYVQGVAQRRIQSFNIKGIPGTPVESLSGGNQQRAMLALLREPLSLLLIEHPTRGLDLESGIDIWGKLKARCQQGAAIIFISSDLDEILQYSDRVLVFFSGQVSRPLDAAATTVEQLGQMIGGKGWENQQAG